MGFVRFKRPLVIRLFNAQTTPPAPSTLRLALSLSHSLNNPQARPTSNRLEQQAQATGTFFAGNAGSAAARTIMHHQSSSPSSAPPIHDMP